MYIPLGTITHFRNAGSLIDSSKATSLCTFGVELLQQAGHQISGLAVYFIGGRHLFNPYCSSYHGDDIVHEVQSSLIASRYWLDLV